MRESRSYGSVRGALSNERPYRELLDSTTRTPGARPVEFIEVNGTGEGVRFRKLQHTMESDSRSLAQALALRCSANAA